MSKKVILFISAVCLLLASCDKEDVQKKREEWLKDSDEFVIGLSYPKEVMDKETHFVDGINMALEEVNKKGVLGKQITISIADDKGAVTVASEIAQNFSDDPKVSAVIGHWYSKVSNTVSEIYNRNHMVMITPASTSTRLTSNGYDYIFSMINDDKAYAGTLARYAAKENLHKIVIYYMNDDYGRGLANHFEDAAYDNNIETVDRVTSINSRTIKKLKAMWEALDYDAILVADVLETAEEVIRTLRKSGIQVPILGATGFDRTSLISSLGIYAEGITVPTLFNPTDSGTKTMNFVQEYEKKFGYLPDSWSAQGYDSIMLLCHAIEAAGSAMPDKIADELRKVTDFQGVSGVFNCNAKGELAASDLYIRKVHNSNYLYTDVFHIDEN
jgi:branched-chain amino acid transport system substrate-binding protein